MQITWARVLSLGMALSYAILAIYFGGIGYWKPALGLLLPLAMIWFPEEIGNLTGYYDSGYVNTRTPAVMISFLGWLILLGLPVLAYLLRKSA
jgi:hypothetical protein